MQFALYRYEFEVMEKKDSSASLFPDKWDNLTPREAFDRKSELLDELLEKDYKMLNSKQSENNDSLPNKASDDMRRVLSEVPDFHYRMSPNELDRILSSEWFKRRYGKSITKRNETIDEQRGEKLVLTFENSSGSPVFHKHLTAPQDGFTILQLGRFPKPIHIIIDNRGTHQRVAIEVKSRAFRTDAVAAMLANTLCKAFACYGLQVKVLPIRDEKYFWNIVSNKELYPKGFKRLRVVFPHINDPELTERMKRAQLEFRKMFNSNLIIVQEAPLGENLHFDEKDEKQQDFMKVCTENADSLELTPIGGRSFKLDGKSVKKQQMSESQAKSIKEGYKSQDLFNDDPTLSTKLFMDKAYGQL